MKRFKYFTPLIWVLSIMLGFYTLAWAVNQKLTELPENEAGNITDTTLFYVVIAGPTSEKYQWSSMKSDMKSGISVDDLITLSGVAEGAANLGTFTGTTINDNQTIKAAIQALETSLELKQAGDADLTTYAGITPSADVQTFLGYANVAAMQAGLSIDNLITLSGVAEGEVNLATFNGSTIADNQTVKQALQALETAVEGKQAADADLTTYAGITPSADIQTFLAYANLAAIKAGLSVDDLVTLSGVADGAVNLGVFTGGVIDDNQTIKQALQALETEIEGATSGDMTKATYDSNDDGKIDGGAQNPPTITSETCVENGSPSTLTITPTAGPGRVSIALTVNDAEGCTITMDDTGLVAGQSVVITNISAANTASFASQAGILNLVQGAMTMDAGESLTLEFKNNILNEIARVETTWDGILIGGFTASAGMVPLTNADGNLSNSYMAFAGPDTSLKTYTLPNETSTIATLASTQAFTNKTLDAAATGNVLKQLKYIVLPYPHLCAAGAPMQTTSTANTYGQCLFGNATDKATNYAEYYLVVPPDVDTAVDLTASFKFKLSNADTGDHEYEISFDSVADSAAYAGTLGDAISLAYTADASGAQNDVETAGETTLTGWRSAMTGGQLFVIRLARDGDHANDGSTVDSYSGPLVIKYTSNQ